MSVLILEKVARSGIASYIGQAFTYEEAELAHQTPKGGLWESGYPVLIPCIPEQDTLEG